MFFHFVVFRSKTGIGKNRKQSVTERMEFDHWSEKNVKNMFFLMDTPSVKKPPKTYAETPPNIYVIYELYSHSHRVKCVLTCFSFYSNWILNKMSPCPKKKINRLQFLRAGTRRIWTTLTTWRQQPAMAELGWTHWRKLGSNFSR